MLPDPKVRIFRNSFHLALQRLVRQGERTMSRTGRVMGQHATLRVCSPTSSPTPAPTSTPTPAPTSKYVRAACATTAAESSSFMHGHAVTHTQTTACTQTDTNTQNLLAKYRPVHQLRLNQGPRWHSAPAAAYDPHLRRDSALSVSGACHNGVFDSSPTVPPSTAAPSTATPRYATSRICAGTHSVPPALTRISSWTRTHLRRHSLHLRCDSLPSANGLVHIA